MATAARVGGAWEADEWRVAIPNVVCGRGATPLEKRIRDVVMPSCRPNAGVTAAGKDARLTTMKEVRMLDNERESVGSRPRWSWNTPVKSQSCAGVREPPQTTWQSSKGARHDIRSRRGKEAAVHDSCAIILPVPASYTTQLSQIPSPQTVPPPDRASKLPARRTYSPCRHPVMPTLRG